WSDLRAIRDGRWKYILAPHAELYDLDRDPGELTNLIAREPARARAMRGGLEQRLRLEQESARSAAAAAAVPPDPLEKPGAAEYEKAAEKLPAYGPAYIAIVDSRLAMDDVAGALAEARKGEAAVPSEPRLFEREADILRRLHDLAGAARAQEKVVALAPSDALAK